MIKTIAYANCKYFFGLPFLRDRDDEDLGWLFNHLSTSIQSQSNRLPIWIAGGTL